MVTLSKMRAVAPPWRLAARLRKEGGMVRRAVTVGWEGGVEGLGDEGAGGAGVADVKVRRRWRGASWPCWVEGGC